MNIAASGPQHPRTTPATMRNFKGSSIGGLFGGRVDLVDAYCSRIIELFEQFTKEGILYKEEQLMTEILSEESFPIKVFKFDTWYHPDWGENRFRGETQISFCDFFDQIK